MYRNTVDEITRSHPLLSSIQTDLIRYITIILYSNQFYSNLLGNNYNDYKQF